jgi:hypothetical protein
LLRGGTIVDATLIAASPSTKNEAGKRDRRCIPRRRAINGTSAHVGVDAGSGLVHTAGVTSGNVHDAQVMDRLIRDDDTAVYGDEGYASDAKKRAAEAAGVPWAVKEKAKPGGRLTARQRARNLRQGARESRTCVSCREVLVRRSQGALSRHRQELGPGVLAVGACKPVSRPQDTCFRLTTPGPSAPRPSLWLAALTKKRSLKPQMIESPR